MIDFERGHDRIGITKVDNIDRPLSNQTTIFNEIIFVDRRIIVEVIPIVPIDHPIAGAVDTLGNQQRDDKQMSRKICSGKLGINITLNNSIIVVIEGNLGSGGVRNLIGFSDFVSDIVTVIIQAVTELTIDIHRQPTKDLRRQQSVQLLSNPVGPIGSGTVDPLISGTRIEDVVKPLRQIVERCGNFVTIGRD